MTHRQALATYEKISAAFRDAVPASKTMLSGMSEIWSRMIGDRDLPEFNAVVSMFAPIENITPGIGLHRPVERAERKRLFHAAFKRIDGAIGLPARPPVDQPVFGYPDVFVRGEYVCDETFLENLGNYVLIRRAIGDRLDPERPIKIVEIGGGFGCLAHILIGDMNVSTYTFVDLPHNLFLCMNYMSNVLPEYRHVLVNERTVPGGGADEKCVYYSLPEHIDRLPSGYDLAINCSSLGEMPAETAAGYLTWLNTVLKDGGLFYSHNVTQACSLEDKEHSVCQLLSEYGFQAFRILHFARAPHPYDLFAEHHHNILCEKAPPTMPSEEVGRVLELFAILINLGVFDDLPPALRRIEEWSGPSMSAKAGILLDFFRLSDWSAKADAIAGLIDDARLAPALRFPAGLAFLLAGRRQEGLALLRACIEDGAVAETRLKAIFLVCLTMRNSSQAIAPGDWARRAGIGAPEVIAGIDSLWAGNALGLFNHWILRRFCPYGETRSGSADSDRSPSE